MIDVVRNTARRRCGTQPLAATAEGQTGEGYGDMARAASTVGSRSTAWAAYVACAWAFVFAAISCYWAAGGTVGADTVGGTIEALGRARDPRFVALLWGTGIAKILLGLLALALVRPWGRVLPRRLLLVAAWGVGAGMAAYGAIQLVVTGVAAGLMATGVISATASVDWTAIRWHLLLWDPWWLWGGVLFGVAACTYQRGARPQPVGVV